MAQWQREGKVLAVVAGENWSILDKASRGLRQRYAFLGKDEGHIFNESEMTLFFECMLYCARRC
jgi:hypothetical protein